MSGTGHDQVTKSFRTRTCSPAPWLVPGGPGREEQRVPDGNQRHRNRPAGAVGGGGTAAGGGSRRVGRDRFRQRGPYAGDAVGMAAARRERSLLVGLGEQPTARVPVEHTAAGSIPHDAVATAGRAHTPQPAGAERTLVIAGCDPIAGLLAHQMAARHGIRVVPLLRSSARALDLLRQGLVHAAGLHWTDPEGRSTNDRSVKSGLGTGYRLLHQVRWDTGIVVVNGRTERSAAALLRSNVRWVNREEGSAARQVLDALLVSRRRPEGYTHIVGDHRAVAATVSSGWAEAGICVKPAAVEAGLRFIPLHQEAYELCVADAQLDDPRIAALVATLQSVAYRQLIADIPGCIAREAGNVRLVA